MPLLYSRATIPEQRGGFNHGALNLAHGVKIMKFYNSTGPNPRIVRMFAAELNIRLDMVEVDIMAGENREAAFLKINPAGQSPALVLADGQVITEITAICEYLDEIHDGDSLIGDDAAARAQTRRWTRWLDLNICELMLDGFRFGEGLPIFKDRMRCQPEASDGLKARAQDQMAMLEQRLKDHAYIAGDRMSLADIVGFGMFDFIQTVGQSLPGDAIHIAAWFEKMSKRPSASA